MSLRDRVAAKNDINSITIEVPQWDNEKVLFKGLTFQESFDLTETPTDTHDEEMAATISLIQKTAYDPETGELAFEGDEGAEFIRSRGSSAITYMLINGTNVVLGVGDVAGKDSSLTATESQTPAV
jgi:hypothetical protein